MKMKKIEEQEKQKIIEEANKEQEQEKIENEEL